MKHRPGGQARQYFLKQEEKGKHPMLLFDNLYGNSLCIVYVTGHVLITPKLTEI